MAKHSQDIGVRRPWRLVVATASVVVLLLGGVVTFFLTRDQVDESVIPEVSSDDRAAVTTSASTDRTTVAPASSDCSPVSVWAAPEVVVAVRNAAERASSTCYVFSVDEQETVRAASALRDGQSPDVWLPGSAAWAQLAVDGGASLEIHDPIASTPVLLVAAQDTLSALAQSGINSESNFAELTSTNRELAAAGEPPFRLRLGDPRVDAASMALLSATRTQDGGWADESALSREALVRLAQTALQGDPLAVIQADARTVGPVTEQQLIQTGSGDLQGLTLAEGMGVVRVPFVIGDGSGSADAISALERELRGDEATADLTDVGFRAGADGPAPDGMRIPADLAVSGVDPSSDDVVAATRAWAAVAPESRILVVVDTSGSMAEEVDGATRIDLARTAVHTAVSVIPEQTTLGLWYFATALQGNADYVERAPLRPLDEEVQDGLSQKDLLLAATDDLGPQTLAGDTGLHDTLWAAYQAMQGQQSDDSISSVLLLTDGVNDDSTGGLSEVEVTALLAEAHAGSDSPVNVVLIGMGPDVDEDALQRLAEAAGGESLLLRDPSELPQVFVNLVANRAQ